MTSACPCLCQATPAQGSSAVSHGYQRGGDEEASPKEASTDGRRLMDMGIRLPFVWDVALERLQNESHFAPGGPWLARSRVRSMTAIHMMRCLHALLTTAHKPPRTSSGLRLERGHGCLAGLRARDLKLYTAVVCKVLCTVASTGL